MKVGKNLALVKFRYDLGVSFVSIAILSASIVSASDKISAATGLNPSVIIFLGVPTVLLGSWCFGYVLDKIEFQHGVNENINERNPQMQELLSQNREILRKIEVIENGRNS